MNAVAVAEARSIAFALEPRQAIHPSWRAALLGHALPESTWNSAAAQPYLARQLSLHDLHADRQSSSVGDLAVYLHLNWRGASRLALCVGACLAGQEIRRSIGHDEVRSLHGVLGTRVHGFCLHQAPLICAGERSTGLSVLDTGYGEALAFLGAQALLQAMLPLQAVWQCFRIKLERVPVLRLAWAERNMPDEQAIQVVRNVARTLSQEWLHEDLC
ncbi:MAG: SctK family type III secretion system sorting platform protein [Burkholderiaceae bacterium]|nr:SctK family type III secretion system sorting platform protein [Burkholderiaceae bacterium]